MNDSSSGGVNVSVNVKGNWAHLAEKNSRPGGKIATIFRFS